MIETWQLWSNRHLNQVLAVLTIGLTASAILTMSAILQLKTSL